MKKIKDRQLSSISAAAAAAAAAFIINSSQTDCLPDCEVQLLSPYLIRPKSALRSPLQASDRISSAAAKQTAWAHQLSAHHTIDNCQITHDECTSCAHLCCVRVFVCLSVWAAHSIMRQQQSAMLSGTQAAKKKSRESTWGWQKWAEWPMGANDHHHHHTNDH